MRPTKEALEQLADELSTADDEQFESFFNEFGELVFKRCYSLLENYDEASDAAQLVWTKVYFALPGFRGDASFKTWLFRVVYNQCISVMRKRYKHVPLDDNIEVDPAHLKDELPELIQKKLDTAQLLEAISHEDRALLIMKYVDGFTYADMAATLRIGESACKMRIARIKQRLTEEYATINAPRRV